MMRCWRWWGVGDGAGDSDNEVLMMMKCWRWWSVGDDEVLVMVLVMARCWWGVGDGNCVGDSGVLVMVRCWWWRGVGEVLVFVMVCEQQHQAGVVNLLIYHMLLYIWTWPKSSFIRYNIFGHEIWIWRLRCRHPRFSVPVRVWIPQRACIFICISADRKMFLGSGFGFGSILMWNLDWI